MYEPSRQNSLEIGASLFSSLGEGRSSSRDVTDVAVGYIAASFQNKPSLTASQKPALSRHGKTPNPLK